MSKPSKVETFARRIANIMGDSSAAAHALREMERRRNCGKRAWIGFDGRTWIVMEQKEEQ